MRKILIVDDKQEDLAEFKKITTPIQDVWNVVFADSGESAMKLLSDATYDAVVSDMFMSNMYGEEFLSNVKKSHPETVRIILSTKSDKEWVMRCAQSAQHILLKSDNLETIVFKVDRACQLRDTLNSKKLKMLIAGIADLPSLPALYVAIMKEMKNPDASLKAIGSIIAKDISMTANILQLVNSSQFGFFREILDPHQAAVCLGLNTLKSLILSFDVFSSFSEDNNYGGSSREELWIHSLMVAKLAKHIASTMTTDSLLLEEIYTAGLLHDVGKLILSKIPKKYKQVDQFIKNNGVDRLDAEYAVMKTSHAELGASLLKEWDLSNLTVETVTFHHDPSSLIKGVFKDLGKDYNKDTGILNTKHTTELLTLTSVHVANSLMIQKELTSKAGPFQYIDMPYLEALGLTDKLPDWAQMCIDSRQKIK